MRNVKKAISLLVACTVLISAFVGTSIPVFALSGTAEYTPVESNLSAKYWVTATASSKPADAPLAVDGDAQTAWLADAADTQPYLELDLGGAYDAVRKTEVVFAGNKAAYQYKIEGSKDRSGWYMLADRTANTRVAGGFTDVFSQEGTRYLRLTITGGAPAGVREFKVINYLRDDMRNGSDMSEQGGNTNTYYYNAGNNPAQPGYRGGKFTDTGSIENGNNIFGLAKDMGWDVVRLRVWNEPKNETNGNPNNNANNCSPANTLRVAKSVKGAGMDLAIDFHYADSWADPQNQPKPYSWASLPFDELVNTTYNFTYDTLSDLVEQGTPPSIVAIGNEITNGMMWGKEYDDIAGVDHHDYYNKGLYRNEFGGGILWKYWHQDQVTPEQYQQYLDSCQRLARLVDAGIRAVRKVAADNNIKIETEVHCAFNVVEGQAKQPLPDSEKLPKVMEFIKQLTSRLGTLGSSLDRIGVSYYQDWHGSWSVLQKNLVEIAKAIPGVKLNIAECSPSSSGTAKADNNHPDGFTYTNQSQGDDTAELLKIINDVPDNRGQGVWPWAGTNVFFTGSGANGTARASMKVWKDAYATSVVESGVYATTDKGVAPVLPATVKNLNVATGEVTQVPVTWEAVHTADYAEAGSFTVKGTASSTGNMDEVTATVTVLNKTTVSDNSVARIDFNDGWQFFLATRSPSVAGGTNNGANFASNGLADAGPYTTAQIISPSFDDSTWRSLSVPHDFSIEGARIPTGSSSAQAYLQGGLGWYRKTFTLPESMEGSRRIALDFEGVYQNANVYVNGQLVGNYPSGYTGFTFDITDYVTYGEDSPNVIAVKVQNMSSSGRWYTGSGIVRPVTLVVTDQTRFIRNGVVITTPTLEQDYKANGSSHMTVSAKAYSDDSNGIVALKTTVYNAAGNAVATKTSDFKDINPSTLCEISDELIVPNVRLWSLEDPYRYTVRTELLYQRNGGSGDAYVVDSTTNKFGFRYFRIDNNEGFFLNDKYTKFQGVDLHHDSGALGAAGTYDAFKRQMTILKSMGVNAYRTSHNPPSKAMIDVCSELGILVMEEAYDGWGSAKATYDFGNFFLKEIPSDWAGSLQTVPGHTLWSDWVIKEMVGRDINEPSVVMWSIGNEVRGVGTRPSWYNWTNYLKPGDPSPSTYTATQFNEYTEALRLRNDIQSLDASRYVVMGGDQERSVPNDTSTWHYVNQALDGFGLNYNTAESVDGLHTKYSNSTFFFESESSSQTGARGVYSDPSMPQTGVNQTPGKRGTSSYDNNFASWTIPNEYGLKKDRDRKYFLGQFIWSGFDYLGEPTPYSVYPVAISSFGTIDTAGFFKDSYHLFKSQWNSTPMAHIVPMNWNDWRIGEEVEVWVNTNAVKAELFLNGVSLGVKSFDTKETTYGKSYYETSEATKDNRLNTSDANKGGYVSPNGSYGKLHLTWMVPYAPGELKAVAMDASGYPVATDILKTAGQAYTVSMKADKSVVKADGRSLVYVECDVVDGNGVMLPSAGNLVKFDIDGGTIVGVDNGKQESTELYKWGNVEKNTHSERSAYNGKVLVIIQTEKGHTGEITLTASSENMAPSKVKVMATADGTGSYTSVSAPVALGAAVSADTVNLTLETGKAPALPKNVKVNYAGGNSLLKKVTWAQTNDSQFSVPGSFQVTGVIDGVTGLSARAAITVTAPAAEPVNLALNTGAGTQDIVTTSGALATASFTNGTSYPNLMLDGNLNNSWTNKYSAGQTVVLAAVNNSHPYEFAEVYWPAPKAMNTINLHFVTGGSNPSTNLPKALNVQYWDGFAWIDATGQDVAWAAASNEATRVTFDRVMTSRVRVGMENATPYSAAAGAMAISEFKVFDLKAALAPAEPPTASLASGTYSGAQSVTLSSATGGADIYYTIDGSTPTTAAAIRYTGPIVVSVDTTLKAIAVKDGMAASSVAEFNYVILSYDQVAPPAASIGSGSYNGPQSVTLSTTTEGADIYYTVDGSTPTTAAAIQYTGPIDVSVDTTLKAIAVKDGMTDSGVAEFSYVILPYSQAAPPAASVPSGIYASAQSITLSSATDGADIYYTVDGSTPTTAAAIRYTGPIAVSVNTTLKAIAVKDGMAASNVAEFSYVILPYSQAAAPTASAGSGTYNGVQSISLSTATEGADIYYTIDGSTPTTAAAIRYTGPIAVSVDTTLKAIAVKDGMAASSVAEFSYVIVPDSPVVPGDVNNNGAVDIGDLAAASFHYSARSGDAGWDAVKAADMNNDGIINIEDLVAIARKLLQE